jgi:hypothetical protein
MVAIMRSIPSDIDRILQQTIGAWKEKYLSSEEWTTFCRVPPVATPEETEADMITFEQNSEDMDATTLEANPEETEAAVERPELFQKEETKFDNIGSSEDRCKAQRLVMRHRRGANMRIRDSVGSRQKLSAACKRVKRRAVPAVRKGHIRKGPGKNNVARGACRGKMLDKRQRNNLECEEGRVGRDLKKRLRLWMKRTSDTCYRKPTKLEMANLIFGSTIELQGVNDWTFWKVRPPPKRKKELRIA